MSRATLEEMARITAETKVTLDVARRRADLIKGLDPEQIIAAAGRTSLAAAAADLADEHAFISARLASPSASPTEIPAHAPAAAPAP